jgi:hypothetical protein
MLAHWLILNDKEFVLQPHVLVRGIGDFKVVLFHEIVVFVNSARIEEERTCLLHAVVAHSIEVGFSI